MKLWYRKHAADWLEGLPIGTGRLAAMILGGVKKERIALNHEWLWRGVNRHRDNEKSAHKLQHVRELLLAEKYEEGTAAANEAFGGTGGISGKPTRTDPYQPAGDLYIELPHATSTNYRRYLDLDTATASIFSVIKREYIAHLKEDLILCRIWHETKKFDASIWLDRFFDNKCKLSFKTSEKAIIMDGAFEGGIKFRIRTEVFQKGGTRRVEGNKLIIEGASEIIIATNIGSSATDKTPAQESLINLSTTDWETLAKTHQEEYSRHYNSAKFEIKTEDSPLPTDERIKNMKAGNPDPGLALLYFNYGRYLLCASSANGELPANLQGKWNEEIFPPWECDYHFDINLQMNYWMAEPAGLSAYAEALLKYIERFVPHAKKAAKDVYGCEGILFPLQTDAWGRSTSEGYGWTAWIGSAAWAAQHIWWHYEYTLDKNYLKKRAYPFLKEVAAFYESYLIEDEDGVLQIVPSQSPENLFEEVGKKWPVSFCVSSAMDIELAADALNHAVKAANILDVDKKKVKIWEEIIDKLPPIKIGSKGQILEWNKEFKEIEPGHRHISHLWGLFPGDQFDPRKTPELFNAAQKSLELRLASFGGHTGWSRAWIACCFARMGKGDEAYSHIEHLITDFATDTLLDLHPPRIFQIDGNLGAAAAVLEMLIQSYHEEINILPALPKAWPEGKVSGLKARGGFTVSIEWKDSKLLSAEISSLTDRECKIIAKQNAVKVHNAEGQEIEVKLENGLFVFNVKKGKKYIFTPLAQ